MINPNVSVASGASTWNRCMEFQKEEMLAPAFMLLWRRTLSKTCIVSYIYVICQFRLHSLFNPHPRSFFSTNPHSPLFSCLFCVGDPLSSIRVSLSRMGKKWFTWARATCHWVHPWRKWHLSSNNHQLLTVPREVCGLVVTPIHAEMWDCAGLT